MYWMSLLRIGITVASILQIAIAALHLYSLKLNPAPPDVSAYASFGWIAVAFAGFLGVVTQFRPRYRHMAVPLNWICGFARGYATLDWCLTRDPNRTDKWGISLFWGVVIVVLCLLNAVGIPRLSQSEDKGAAEKEPIKDIVDCQKNQNDTL
jgi:hypothetical protein